MRRKRNGTSYTSYRLGDAGLEKSRLHSVQCRHYCYRGCGPLEAHSRSHGRYLIIVISVLIVLVLIVLVLIVVNESFSKIQTYFSRATRIALSQSARAEFLVRENIEAFRTSAEL